MKTKIALILLIQIPWIAIAGEKSTVTLTESGYSASGGGNRPKEVGVKISMGFRNEPILIAKKIDALERQLAFYRLMSDNKVDLDKEITAAYANQPLGKIFEELIPGVPIEFRGVDRNETVESMAITKAPLEKVLQYLDEAAGVFFTFSADGIIVTNEP